MKEVRNVPTQKPDNEIIRIAESTVNLPSTGKVNKQVPSYDLRTVGYDKNYRIFAEELNYTLDNIGQWCQYFITLTDEIKDVTIPDLEDKVDQEVIDRTEQGTNLNNKIEKERVSVGEIITFNSPSVDISNEKGYGTWSYLGESSSKIGNSTDLALEGYSVTSNEVTEGVTDSGGFIEAVWEGLKDPQGLFSYDTLTGVFTTLYAGTYLVNATTTRQRQASGSSTLNGRILVNGVAVAERETLSNDFSTVPIETVAELDLNVGDTFSYQSKGATLIAGGGLFITYSRPQSSNLTLHHYQRTS